MAKTATKSSNLTYTKAVDQLKKGDLSPVYFIYGEEKYLHDELINLIIDSSLDSGEKDFNLDIFYANETSAEKIINVSRSFPMMAQRRVVVVKDVQQLKATDLKHLADYVNRPSKSSCLILSLPERKKAGKWFTVIFNNALSIDCRKLYDNEVPAWLEGYLQSKKFAIAKEAIRLLQAQVGNSLLDLVNELEKIQINIHPRLKITLEDVQSVTSISKQFNIFELCNAVGEKKFPRAITILNKLLDQGESPTGMIIQLMRHFVNLMKISENIRRGNQSTSELMKVTGLTYYFVNDMMKQSRNFLAGQYRNSFSYLAEADSHLKTGYQKPGLVMELLLYKLIKG
jgi:DNA polymerase-3 subunit delta